MEFSLNETQADIRDRARRFSDEELRPLARQRDQTGEFPLDSFRKMAELGLMGVNVDKAYGGLGAGVVAYSLAVSEIARGDASVAVTMAVNNMVAEVIQAFGTEDQRRAYIPRLTSGEFSSGSFCLSEPGSGSDAASLLTRAVRCEEGWRITGSKAWITSGTYAGVFLVWAKAANDAGEELISLFLVDPALDGVTIGKPEKKMGQHASNTVPISFDGVIVPEDAVLGEVGEGFKIAMMALDGGRVGIASQALGIGLEALSLVREHALDGKTVNEDKLAEMATELEAARQLTMRAAWLKELGTRRFSREASMAKLFSTDAAWRAANETVHLLGGKGYTTDTLAEKLLRDVRVTKIYEGTNEIQRIVIARDLTRYGY
ncbi:MAG: acyl-CoA dehydrogenase family protein [Bradymonadaceae bacterium]